MASHSPTQWRILRQELGAVDALVLGDSDDDAYRIALTVVVGIGGPEIDSSVFYPCRNCGWKDACGDCHS